MDIETSTALTEDVLSELISAIDVEPEARQRMIQEAAYYRYLERGCIDGQDLDDWLAAEADLAGEGEAPEAGGEST